jgi:hypothetical protein
MVWTTACAADSVMFRRHGLSSVGGVRSVRLVLSFFLSRGDLRVSTRDLIVTRVLEPGICATTAPC